MLIGAPSQLPDYKAYNQMYAHLSIESQKHTVRVLILAQSNFSGN